MRVAQPDDVAFGEPLGANEVCDTEAGKHAEAAARPDRYPREQVVTTAVQVGAATIQYVPGGQLADELEVGGRSTARDAQPGAPGDAARIVDVVRPQRCRLVSKREQLQYWR